jgi:glycosyltransferase-like protein
VERREDEDVETRILRYADALADGLRNAGPAGVHHAEDCLSARSLLLLRAAGWGGEFVRTVHHVDEFTSPILADCQRASILEPEHLVCVSRHWQERLATEFDVAARMIPNGVDAARFADEGATRDEARSAFDWTGRRVVLAVGGIEPRKGSRALLAAFARLHRNDPQTVLAIAGGETLFDYAGYRATWEEDLHGFGLDEGDTVRILGRIDDDAMPGMYRGADVLAMPSEREGFGLVAIEAMAAGTPVVLSDLAVFRENFTDGGDCLMAPVGDVAELAGALDRTLGDVALRGRLRDGGRATAARFSWDAAAAAHEDLYLGVKNGG